MLDHRVSWGAASPDECAWGVSANAIHSYRGISIELSPSCSLERSSLLQVWSPFLFPLRITSLGRTSFPVQNDTPRRLASEEKRPEIPPGIAYVRRRPPYERLFSTWVG